MAEQGITDQSTLKYTAEHEWLSVQGDIATVGITAYAAEKLGDVVFVELPAVGASVASGKIVGEIESTKSVGELFAPVDGTVTEVNDAVVAHPELVNSDPFGEGWLIKVSFTELPTLLSFDEYTALVGE
jgi:glycine cleavage system H protein